jgi:hypothetical protein
MRWGSLVHFFALVVMLALLSVYQASVGTGDGAITVTTVYCYQKPNSDGGQMVKFVGDRFLLHWVGCCNGNTFYGRWRYVDRSKIVLESTSNEQFRGEFLTVDGRDCLLVGTVLMPRVRPRG